MTKRDVRQRIWNLLNDANALRFPGPLHGIPNFEHADRAARRLRELAVWRRAAVVKVCADVPQLFVRRLCTPSAASSKSIRSGSARGR
jgi:5-formyltetrahydrofolate cyclo-ligase